MTAKRLVAEGFCPPLVFSSSEESFLMLNLPRTPGVYVLAEDCDSEIRYIGCAANEKGLQQRIRQYFHPGPTQRTNRRINALLQAGGRYLISYRTAPSRHDAQCWESDLLFRFEKTHGRLPLWNRQGPRLIPA